MLELLVLVLGLGSEGNEDGPCVGVVEDIYDVQQEGCALRRTRNGDLKRLAHGWWRRSPGTRYRRRQLLAPTGESRGNLGSAARGLLILPRNARDGGHGKIEAARGRAGVRPAWGSERDRPGQVHVRTTTSRSRQSVLVLDPELTSRWVAWSC